VAPAVYGLAFVPLLIASIGTAVAASAQTGEHAAQVRLAVDDDSHHDLADLAALHAEQGDSEGAFVLQRAFARGRRNPLHHMRLAQMAAEAGHCDQAEAALANAERCRARQPPKRSISEAAADFAARTEAAVRRCREEVPRGGSAAR
jgi:hypothetical protein